MKSYKIEYFFCWILFLLPISMIAPKAIAPLFVITVLVSVITNIFRGDIDWRIGQTEVITGMAIAIALCSVGWSSTPLDLFSYLDCFCCDASRR